MGESRYEEGKDREVSGEVRVIDAEGFASQIIDLASEFEIVEDYEIELLENIVVKARIELRKGFVEVYRNFETDKVAFAWILDRERIYGADNTGGWHIHPKDDPSKHKQCEPVNLEDFLEGVERFIEGIGEE